MKLVGNIERERRFLLRTVSIAQEACLATSITQGYIFGYEGFACRIRVCRPLDKGRQDELAYGTFKGPRSGADRIEEECKLDAGFAWEFLKHIPNKIAKTRHSVISYGETWEVDQFFGLNEGLWIAECEFEHDAMSLNVPAWCGIEVTNDRRFDNDVLAFHPLAEWKDEYVREFGPLIVSGDN